MHDNELSQLKKYWLYRILGSLILGDKTYVATTVGKECILGASIAKDAGQQSLQGSYQVFKDEAQCLKPGYAPTTVNMDGWKATRKVWKALFSSVVMA